MIARWAFAALVSATLAGGRDAELHRYEAVEPHMGTLVRITLFAPGEQAANAAFRAAFARIATLDRILSDYQPDSELSQITVRAVGRPVPVSRDLFTVLAASQDLAEASGGAFDVTQGPVIRLWRAARQTGQVPDEVALRDAATRSGFRKLHLDRANQTAAVDCAGMALDVGGIGKGYAASEALAVISSLGVGSALVAVSGDLAFSDAPPGQRGWRVGIHSGDPPLAGIPEVMELVNAAVSTSGDSQQHLDIDGRRYSHIIDPASGIGLVSDIRVTVVAPHGLESDGLDTAISVLGPARGLALVEAHRAAAALVVVRTGAGTIVRPSASFLDLVSRQNSDAATPSGSERGPYEPSESPAASPAHRARSQQTGK